MSEMNFSGESALVDMSTVYFLIPKPLRSAGGESKEPEFPPEVEYLPGKRFGKLKISDENRDKVEELAKDFTVVKNFDVCEMIVKIFCILIVRSRMGAFPEAHLLNQMESFMMWRSCPLCQTFQWLSSIRVFQRPFTTS